ncbi:hypothetical protein ACWD5R_44200, partial [Streptomyces sp. NPDC002514]
PQVQKGRNGRWELIGVTSGPGAPKVPCSEGPGLYTSAPAYAGWINKTMKNHHAVKNHHHAVKNHHHHHAAKNHHTVKNHHAAKNHHAVKTNHALSTAAMRSDLAETGTKHNTSAIAQGVSI